MGRKKHPNDRKAAKRAEPRPEEVDNEARELPNREVMTLIDPNMLGGGLLGSATAPTASPTGSPVPITQPASDGTSLLDRFMPKTPPGTDQPYQPTTSSTAES